MCLATLKGAVATIHLWAPVNEVEGQALDQLKQVAALPWVFHHVAVMPDVHFGKGATVGSVIAMKQAVSPAAVGVDIGCGMAAVRTSLLAEDLPDSLIGLRSDIEASIPVGFNQHRSVLRGVEHLDLWRGFGDLVPQVQDLRNKAMAQCGTLGGGNHFIEVCLDEAHRVWLMLHSGSRNIGKVLAEIHINRAKKLAHNAHLPDKDLAVFLAGTPDMAAYRRDLMWAQTYAFANRQAMLNELTWVMKAAFPGVSFESPILCHHNYVSEEIHYGEKVMVTRKGAIRAEKGEMGIIPGSMGAKSYIVRGLGNPDSFCSAAHGAGRRMSRHEAKRRFSVQDLSSQTYGVECRKDPGVIDEIPGAYKDIDEVMANQADLVETVHSLKQVLCVKG
ncbi:RtcB family protein [Geothrix fuzhouensis]|uniref:RtcB family protein n=1 Tax=Geothrix fuzhouensis TaxID=2966451 RepID=UPI002148EFA6|nr:RtcB family protein [Geothrix fuzhouensis]